jgi:hypothetical protein
MKNIDKWNYRIMIPFTVGVLIMAAIRLAEVLAGLQ